MPADRLQPFALCTMARLLLLSLVVALAAAAPDAVAPNEAAEYDAKPPLADRNSLAPPRKAPRYG